MKQSFDSPGSPASSARTAGRVLSLAAALPIGALVALALLVPAAVRR
ncbi:hypothetical protein [Streptomonospora salina]|uniref:Uncharacterized protein n=1 Tax=Streptomonospora salina TaxID=104205 RepID=A0A841EI14_9ACTN|nr:hypothetical protein [Streptomonospora salina]MBB6000683.1 hypothetical protein [Streptomonospora salina]